MAEIKRESGDACTGYLDGRIRHFDHGVGRGHVAEGTGIEVHAGHCEQEEQGDVEDHCDGRGDGLNKVRHAPTV